MANNTLKQIRERLAAAEQNQGGNYDKATFAFWNAKPDTTSVLRFVPDGDVNNTFFWVEKIQIKLPFNGIKGGEAKPITVSVPCVEMFGREAYPQGCPILSEVRVWYKDPSLVEKANKYWKKPSYIMQGFVRENAVTDDQAPENPIRRFSLNKQLFNLVKAGLMDPEMENIPCDYEKGSDFRVIKTTKGQYADYGTSSYARRESSLSEVELAAIEQYGLSNLSDFLGKKPTEEDLVVIKEMFEASCDGEAYDPARWGRYYSPMGFKTDKDKEKEAEQNQANASSETEATVSATAKTPSKKSAKVTDTTVESAKLASPAKSNAADILALIKSRAAAKA